MVKKIWIWICEYDANNPGVPWFLLGGITHHKLWPKTCAIPTADRNRQQLRKIRQQIPSQNTSICATRTHHIIKPVLFCYHMTPSSSSSSSSSPSSKTYSLFGNTGAHNLAQPVLHSSYSSWKMLIVMGMKMSLMIVLMVDWGIFVEKKVKKVSTRKSHVMSQKMEVCKLHLYIYQALWCCRAWLLICLQPYDPHFDFSISDLFDMYHISHSELKCNVLN